MPGSSGGKRNGPSLLKLLDYSVVQQCIHCGLCLPTCPTYDLTKQERHSPRGRISLMRAIADEKLEVSRVFGEEMYFCLGCLACMSACPAGVNYAELFETARAEVESEKVLNTSGRRLIRGFAIHWLFMELSRLKLAGLALRLYQELGFQAVVRLSGVTRLLPKRLRELELMIPDIRAKATADLLPQVLPAGGRRRFRVALLSGCAQDLMFSEINADTAEVLAYNGCEVFTPPDQYCCGSLHAHNGELEVARTLAREQIDQFSPEKFDAIITNAGGCGSHLKHYSKLLKDDVKYREKALLWDAKIKDIHEWLVGIGIRAPKFGEQQVVTYHESCHLTHGQKITKEPRELLRFIPNLKLVELPEASWCCGSAGVYNLVQPEMAELLQERKLRHISSTGARTVASGNPGCLLQLVNGAKKRGIELRVVHPITLLAEAYRYQPGSSFQLQRSI